MFVTAVVLALALAVVGGVAGWLSTATNLSRGRSVGVVAAAMWLTAVSVIWLSQEEPIQRSELQRPRNSLAWPGGDDFIAPAPSSAASATGIQAASVESLVAGLEERLAAEPNDANGWALLAQSYAYTADEEAVERAVSRAVELGVDERPLRERIEAAKRSVHAADWVERAIGARRP